MRALIASVSIAVAVVGCSRRDGRTTIQNKGSDTMVNVAQAWAEEYQKIRPNVGIAVSGGGSGTGIASITNGTVDIANSSRDLKADERSIAKQNTGKDVIEHVVAYDALAIYVHESNPLAKITKTNLACIFGEEGTCTKWTDLGVEVPTCAGQEIVRVSRQNNSGTYAFFREWVMGEKDLKLGSRDMQGSKDVVDLVERTPCAIGYSGLGYKTPQVKTICVATTDDGACVEPTIAGAISGEYPMSRALFMFTVGEPQGEVARYIAWVRSDAGQVVVEQSGYAPLPKDKRPAVPQ
jgi:phosphate transport system substrate-binding protein